MSKTPLPLVIFYFLYEKQNALFKKQNSKQMVVSGPISFGTYEDHKPDQSVFDLLAAC